ncbi:TPA: hypothetical protein ACQYF6_002249 [Vibrio parahaemolyticus]
MLGETFYDYFFNAMKMNENNFHRHDCGFKGVQRGNLWQGGKANREEFTRFANLDYATINIIFDSCFCKSYFLNKDMIKNWTVIAEPAKCVIARERYLNDKHHKNHTYTEKIKTIFGNENHSLNMIRNCEKYKLFLAQKRKGGRPPKPAIEFVISLPKGIRPSYEQWRSMFNIVMRNLARSLNVEPKNLAPITRAVLHQQNQEKELKGAGDHVHILLGKFTNDLVYLRDLQRKSTTRLIKQSFNVAMIKVMGISNQDYQPTKEYNGHAKKRAPSWAVKAAREKEKLTEQNKRLMRIIEQAKKWLEAYELQNIKQMNRQFNRINKELNELEGISCGETDQATIELISTLFMKIDSKQKKTNLRNNFKNKFALPNL